MNDLTEAGRQTVADVSRRHGVSEEAVLVLLRALVAGQGSQAQFNHSELGGMGQWSMGGMTMIGDMFNNGLKARVDALCSELSGALRQDSLFAESRPTQSSQSQNQSNGDGYNSNTSLFVQGGSYGNWWPEGLGQASSTGSQNNMRYALFPQTHRLAIDLGGKVSVYDTLDHWITGFSQQQSGDQSLTLTSQNGLVRILDLPLIQGGGNVETVSPQETAKRPEPENFQSTEPYSTSQETPAAPTASIQPTSGKADASGMDEDEIFRKIERLADLRKKDILSQQEYETKKAELLARL